MRHLDWRQWPKDDKCTYRVWCYQGTVLRDPHTHNFHELFWVESGQGFHWINGDKQPIKTGDLILIRAEDAHTFAASGGQYLQFVNVAFCTGSWERLKQRYFSKKRCYYSEKMVERRSFRLNRMQLERMSYLSMDLRNGARDALAVESFLAGVCSMLENPGDRHSTKEVPDWLAKACVLIQDFPNFAGGPSTLIRLAGKSPEHVARVCRKYLQRRPCDLVNEARMHYAAQELRQTERAVLDVALDCGIENLGHFYKLFRERYGVAPVEYRSKERHAKPDRTGWGG
jgi:AraC family cel operon transcriptional repressor